MSAVAPTHQAERQRLTKTKTLTPLPPPPKTEPPQAPRRRLCGAPVRHHRMRSKDSPSQITASLGRTKAARDTRDAKGPTQWKGKEVNGHLDSVGEQNKTAVVAVFVRKRERKLGFISI